MAIRHRKTSLSYKIERGAQVGDRFMSLSQTCRLDRVNPFDCFTALVRDLKEVLVHPEQWLRGIPPPRLLKSHVDGGQDLAEKHS